MEKISLFYNFFWKWILKLPLNHSQDLFPECELLVLSAMLGVDNDRAAQPLDAGRLSFAKANQYWQKRGKMRAKRIKGWAGVISPGGQPSTPVTPQIHQTMINIEQRKWKHVKELGTVEKTKKNWALMLRTIFLQMYQNILSSPLYLCRWQDTEETVTEYWFTLWWQNSSSSFYC